jgi:hypothetical protein
MDQVEWMGVTGSELLNDWVVDVHTALADAGRDYDWTRLLSVVTENPTFVNSTRPAALHVSHRCIRQRMVARHTTW